MAVHVLSYDTAHPGDVQELAEALRRFSPQQVRRLALLVKTEGNADSNDYSREYASVSARTAIEAFGGPDLVKRCTFLFSTGCEGILSPFGYLFVDTAEDGPVGGQRRALVFAGARSRPIAAAELGTVAHAALVAATVRAAMAELSVTEADVELVIIKTPVTSAVAGDDAAYAPRITSALSKAIGALGAGLALGEVDQAAIRPDAFDRDHTLHARRAMVFSSSEGGDVEVFMLANRAGAAGDFLVKTGAFRDLLDAHGIRRTLLDAGCSFDADGALADPHSVVAAFVKAGIASDGKLRDYRTTMRTSHLDSDKHIRAAMSGMVGPMLGTCRMFISANTVHQAPDGGGLCAFIVKARQP